MSNYNISDDNEFLIHYHIDEIDTLHERKSTEDDLDFYVNKRGIPKERMSQEDFLKSCKSFEKEPDAFAYRSPFIDYDEQLNSNIIAERFPFIYISRIKIIFTDDSEDVFRLTCRKDGVNLRISEKGLKIMYNKYWQRNPLDVTYHIPVYPNPFITGPIAGRVLTVGTAPIQTVFHKAFIHRMVNAVMLCMMLDDGVPFRRCITHLKCLDLQSRLLMTHTNKICEKQDIIKHASEISRYFKSKLNPKAHEELMDMYWQYCVLDPK